MAVRAAGFTLIEMLVVVAILVMLLAWAYPSIRVAYQKTQQAACLGRLHQLHLAALAYAQDNKGVLPLQNNSKQIRDGLETQRKTYGDYLMPYLGRPVSYTDVNRDGTINHLDTDPYLNGQEFFRCPGALRNPQKIGSLTRWVLDYGINHYGYGASERRERIKFHPSMSGVRINDVANPSVVYFGDAEAEQSPENIGALSRGTLQWPIIYSFQSHAFVRHLEGYNTVSLDGAGEWTYGLKPSNERWFIRRPG